MFVGIINDSYYRESERKENPHPLQMNLNVFIVCQTSNKLLFKMSKWRFLVLLMHQCPLVVSAPHDNTHLKSVLRMRFFTFCSPTPFPQSPFLYISFFRMIVNKTEISHEQTRRQIFGEIIILMLMKS